MSLSDINCTQAKSLIQQGALLVDVRSSREYHSGALPGAVNLPLEQIASGPQVLESDKPIILYCVTGLRSGKAKQIVLSMGFATVHNLGSFRNFNC